MIYKSKNLFYHGVMFHHFHDKKKHKEVQGSISSFDLYKIVGFVGRKNILDADEFVERYKEKKLGKSQTCFTFDDGLKCQIDIALPVLSDLNIKSFFFIPTSNYENDPNYLEVYRYFRTTYYESINLFYEEFYKILDIDLQNFFKKKEKKINLIKKNSQFYSTDDIKFRLVRDELISYFTYHSVMMKLFSIYKFDSKFHLKNLYMNEKDIKKIISDGHTIGLHSHTHPTKIERLSLAKQTEEYRKNILSLSKITGIKTQNIKSLSHPCGSYNADTLKVLKKMKLDIAFKESINIDKGMKKRNPNKYEIAREDHSNIIKMINE